MVTNDQPLDPIIIRHEAGNELEKSAMSTVNLTGSSLQESDMSDEYIHTGYIPNMYTAVQPSNNERICSHNNLKCEVSSNQSCFIIRIL